MYTRAFAFLSILMLIACTESHEAKLAREAKATEERRKGFHCLSGWDGSHRDVVNQVREKLRDPGSFEHVETRIAAADDHGKHRLIMRYRAANGFGGKTLGSAVAVIKNSDCTAVVTTFE